MTSYGTYLGDTLLVDFGTFVPGKGILCTSLGDWKTKFYLNFISPKSMHIIVNLPEKSAKLFCHDLISSPTSPFHNVPDITFEISEIL